MTAAGLAGDEWLSALDIDSVDSTRRAATAMFGAADPPTAVFAAQNEITVRVLRFLQQHDGGRDVGLVGFDDFPLADMFGVTVVAEDVDEIGRTAASLLFDRIDGDRSPAGSVTRSSPGPPEKSKTAGGSGRKITGVKVAIGAFFPPPFGPETGPRPHS